MGEIGWEEQHQVYGHIRKSFLDDEAANCEYLDPTSHTLEEYLLMIFQTQEVAKQMKEALEL